MRAASSMLGALGAALLLGPGCTAPEAPTETVGYRDGAQGGPTSGERGTVQIYEILWSGSVKGETWDPKDVFVELRNVGSRPVNLSRWRLRLSGTYSRNFVLPDFDKPLEVGDQLVIAAKSDGCFPDPDVLLPDLVFPLDDAFELGLVDADERLMETAGDRNFVPFAGGYDLTTSRSMERIPLMFGADSNRSQAWKFYQAVHCPGDTEGLNCFIDGTGKASPNNDRVLPECRRHTHASPGQANSPDYSGSFANGSFE